MNNFWSPQRVWIVIAPEELSAALFENPFAAKKEICIASLTKNEFSSEGLRLFNQKYPAGKQKHVPANAVWENWIADKDLFTVSDAILVEAHTVNVSHFGRIQTSYNSAAKRQILKKLKYF